MRRPDEKGVSPVIGVILMVAITVILAAVIASFVFGLGGTVQKPKQPAITAKRVDSDTVEFTLYDLGGATNVTECKVTCSGTGSNCDSKDLGNFGNTIGTTLSTEGKCNCKYGRVLLVCDVDGNTQVVLDTTV